MTGIEDRQVVQIWNGIRVDFREETIGHGENKRVMYDKTEQNYNNTLMKQDAW